MSVQYVFEMLFHALYMEVAKTSVTQLENACTDVEMSLLAREDRQHHRFIKKLRLEIR